MLFVLKERNMQKVSGSPAVGVQAFACGATKSTLKRELQPRRGPAATESFRASGCSALRPSWPTGKTYSGQAGRMARAISLSRLHPRVEGLRVAKILFVPGGNFITVLDTHCVNEAVPQRLGMAFDFGGMS